MQKVTSTFKTPLHSCSTELVVKKSRFIAVASHVQDREQALAAIAELRQNYPDARHHCWAYLLGAPQAAVSAAMSDDGEPSGTAGKPILNVLQHKDVGDVLIVVVRYFGGIKLGAGGLVRAYSSAAQAVMEILPTQIHVPSCFVTVTIGFDQEQRLRHWLSQHDGSVINADYMDRVRCLIELPAHHQALLESTAGEYAWIIDYA